MSIRLEIASLFGFDESLKSFLTSYLSTQASEFEAALQQKFDIVAEVYSGMWEEYFMNVEDGSFSGPHDYVPNRDRSGCQSQTMGCVTEEIKDYLYKHSSFETFHHDVSRLVFVTMLFADPLVVSQMLKVPPKCEFGGILDDFSSLCVAQAWGSRYVEEARRVITWVGNHCHSFYYGFLLCFVSTDRFPSSLLPVCTDAYFKLLKQSNEISLKKRCLQVFEEGDWGLVCTCGTGTEFISICRTENYALHAQKGVVQGYPVLGTYSQQYCVNCYGSEKLVPEFFLLLGANHLAVNSSRLDILDIADVYLNGSITKDGMQYSTSHRLLGTNMQLINSLPILSTVWSSLLELNITKVPELITKMHLDIQNNYYKRSYKNLDPRLTATKKKVLQKIIRSIVHSYTGKKRKMPEHLKKVQLRPNETDVINKIIEAYTPRIHAPSHSGPIEVRVPDFKCVQKVLPAPALIGQQPGHDHAPKAKGKTKTKNPYHRKLNNYLWLDLKVVDVATQVSYSVDRGTHKKSLKKVVTKTPMVKATFTDCLYNTLEYNTENLICLMNRTQLWSKNKARKTTSDMYTKRNTAPLSGVLDLPDMELSTLKSLGLFTRHYHNLLVLRSMLKGDVVPVDKIPKIYCLIREECSKTHSKTAITVENYYPDDFNWVQKIKEVNKELVKRVKLCEVYAVWPPGARQKFDYDGFVGYQVVRRRFSMAVIKKRSAFNATLQRLPKDTPLGIDKMSAAFKLKKKVIEREISDLGEPCVWFIMCDIVCSLEAAMRDDIITVGQYLEEFSSPTGFGKSY